MLHQCFFPIFSDRTWMQQFLEAAWQVKSISTPPPPSSLWQYELHLKCEFLLNTTVCLHPTVMKSDDSLVQQGWPFHKGGDMWGRSPWLNGTPLSDCQSSGCHRVASLSSGSKYYARTPGWINLPLRVAAPLQQLPDLSELLWNVWSEFTLNKKIYFAATCKDSS